MARRPVRTWYRCIVLCAPGYQFDTRREALLHVHQEHGLTIMESLRYLNLYKVSSDMYGFGRLGQRNLA